MNKEDIIRMAREVGFEADAAGVWITDGYWTSQLERFAALVDAHVNAKEKERQRYDLHSCGPTCDRYICVAIREAVEEEREECAKLCDYLWESKASEAYECATAIRKRVNYE